MILRQLIGYALAIEVAQVSIRVLTGTPVLYRWDDMPFVITLALAISPFGQMCAIWVKNKWSRLIGWLLDEQNRLDCGSPIRIQRIRIGRRGHVGPRVRVSH